MSGNCRWSCRESYIALAGYPGEEKFGLVSQMRRAAVSVPSNLAEGAARSSNNEFRNFLSIARSSLSELDTQLDLSQQLGFITEQARAEVDGPLTRVDKSERAGERESGRARQGLIRPFEFPTFRFLGHLLSPFPTSRPLNLGHLVFDRARSRLPQCLTPTRLRPSRACLRPLCVLKELP